MLELFDGSCPFCLIINGKMKAERLYESEMSVAFLDINPINYGHALVVSKKHYRDFSDLPEDVFIDLVHTLRIVAKAIVNAVNPDGFNIFNNNGAAAGQTVFHFHFHVAPRYKDDGLKFRPIVKSYDSPEHMSDYAKRIREKINSTLNLGDL
ncbi:MAG: HIT family protein [Candidatus Kryptoniota bacterium]